MTAAPASTPHDDLLDTIREYWDRRAAGFGSGRGHGGRELLGDHPLWLGVVAQLLAGPPGARPLRRVADMGTGTGAIAEFLATLGREVIAVEFAPSMVERAQARLAPYAGVEVRLGDVQAPPLEPGEVDAIVGRNVMWLLPDPERTLRAWTRLVGPGGRVAVIDGTSYVERRLARAGRRLLRARAASSGFPGRDELPLASVRDPADYEALWRGVGMVGVQTIDLHWVDVVEQLRWTRRQRWSWRSRRFAVVGDVAAGS